MFLNKARRGGKQGGYMSGNEGIEAPLAEFDIWTFLPAQVTSFRVLSWSKSEFVEMFQELDTNLENTLYESCYILDVQ